MSIFSRMLAVLKGIHSFPQPIRRVMPIVLLLASSLATPYLVAQTSGRIAGVVKDASGAVIPNSKVIRVPYTFDDYVSLSDPLLAKAMPLASNATSRH